MYHLKIVLVGPSMSGKTAIANFLSDSVENIGGEYRPTAGVRIVEFETLCLNGKQSGLKADVELWDCSGDLKYESLWPAVYRDAHGIIFVYQPNNVDVSRKLDHFFEYFVNQSGNSALNNCKNCLLIKHHKNDEDQQLELSDYFSQITSISVNMEERGTFLRNEFCKFITHIVYGVKDLSGLY